MPPPEPKPDPALQAAMRIAHLRERRAQLRGLLVLALLTLAFLVWRSRPLNLFHPGWWRL